MYPGTLRPCLASCLMLYNCTVHNVSCDTEAMPGHLFEAVQLYCTQCILWHSGHAWPAVGCCTTVLYTMYPMSLRSCLNCCSFSVHLYTMYPMSHDLLGHTWPDAGGGGGRPGSLLPVRVWSHPQRGPTRCSCPLHRQCLFPPGEIETKKERKERGEDDERRRRD